LFTRQEKSFDREEQLSENLKQRDSIIGITNDYDYCLTKRHWGIYLKYRQWRGAPVKDVVVYKYPLKVPTPESQNICRIFRVNGIDTGSTVLESVWINENGELQSQPYDESNVKNFIKFNCAISQSLIPDTDPSFHWASCLHLNTPSTENSNKGKEEGEKKEFKGKFTLYAVGAGVKDKKIKTIYFEEKR
jgi:hypothetical protein